MDLHQRNALELETLKLLVIFLLARDYAVKREPLAEAWSALLHDVKAKVVQDMDNPTTDQIAAGIEHRARAIFDMAEKLAKHASGAG
jgi:hypothetical protein